MVHHSDQGEVKEAGKAVLKEAQLNENDRAEVEILTQKIIRGVQQDHAIMFTGMARGNMVLAGDSVFILEATPAAYLMIAGNEALKAAEVKLIDIRPFGATGRLILSGSESEIDSSAEAAIRILKQLNDMKASGPGQQLG
jgi:ethanolamine utilization microcompartment shell protein EutS